MARAWRAAVSIGAAMAMTTSQAAAAPASPATVTFTGDVMLSRLVDQALRHAAPGSSPWAPLAPDGSLGLLIGNFEGAVGVPSDCPPGQSLCFATDAAWLGAARAAGFDLLGLENNHAGDTGPAGRGRTREAVASAGMTPLSFDAGPAFIELGGRTLAIVTLSRLAAADREGQALDVALAQQIDTARQLADAVVVSVHWGSELADWASRAQYDDASALLRLGADVIVGHHPHVVQAPECIDGHPVFFSLGNHVFDQKYAGTKAGLVAQCGWTADGGLSCAGLRTAAVRGGFFPRLTGEREPVCAAPARARLTIDGIAISAGPRQRVGGAMRQRLRFEPPSGPAFEAVVGPVRRVQAMSLDRGRGNGSSSGSAEALTGLLLLEERYSDFDKRVAPRPYVYAVDPPEAGGSREGRAAPGRLRALWRGTALAYPLIDAVVLPSATPAGGEMLCALHEASSFLAGPALDAQGRPASPLTLAYRWNGFGFSRAPSQDDQRACAARFRDLSRAAP